MRIAVTIHLQMNEHKMKLLSASGVMLNTNYNKENNPCNVVKKQHQKNRLWYRLLCHINVVLFGGIAMKGFNYIHLTLISATAILT